MTWQMALSHCAIWPLSGMVAVGNMVGGQPGLREQTGGGCPAMLAAHAWSLQPCGLRMEAWGTGRWAFFPEAVFRF